MPIEPIEDPRSDVASEKSLWDAVSQSWLVVGRTSDLMFPLFGGAAVLLVGVIVNANVRVIGDYEIVAAAVNGWSVLMSQVISSILGFLIAGFAIFASFPRKSLFWKLASFRSNGRKISEFKFIMFNFLITFLVYLVTLSFDLFSVLATDGVSPAMWLLERLSAHDEATASYVMFTYAVVFVCINLYAVLVLRGFIWNLYQAILISIFGEKPADE